MLVQPLNLKINDKLAASQQDVPIVPTKPPTFYSVIDYFKYPPFLMNPPWRDYQEDAASLFRSMGLEASTDITIQGVRTEHDIDVLVKSHHVGFEVTWLVECKHWKTPVSKLHVLGLREIVADVGADRGIILCEAGFQSGALEAANLTNVRLTSLANIRNSATNDIFSMRLYEIAGRVETCKERYFNIPKSKRIEYGLRDDIWELSYSGWRVIQLCNEVLFNAFRGVFPFKNDTPIASLVNPSCAEFKSPQEVVIYLDPMVCELEEKLDETEKKLAELLNLKGN